MPTAMFAQEENKVLFYESFDGLNGQGGNDGYFDNDEAAGVEVGSEDLLSAETLYNKDGWGDFVKVAICNKCIRIATKKNSGAITTPAFTAKGNATLTVRHLTCTAGKSMPLEKESSSSTARRSSDNLKAIDTLSSTITSTTIPQPVGLGDGRSFFRHHLYSFHFCQRPVCCTFIRSTLRRQITIGNEARI